MDGRRAGERALIHEGGSRAAPDEPAARFSTARGGALFGFSPRAADATETQRRSTDCPSEPPGDDDLARSSAFSAMVAPSTSATAAVVRRQRRAAALAPRRPRRRRSTKRHRPPCRRTSILPAGTQEGAAASTSKSIGRGRHSAPAQLRRIPPQHRLLARLARRVRLGELRARRVCPAARRRLERDEPAPWQGIASSATTRRRLDTRASCRERKPLSGSDSSSRSCRSAASRPHHRAPDRAAALSRHLCGSRDKGLAASGRRQLACARASHASRRRPDTRSAAGRRHAAEPTRGEGGLRLRRQRGGLRRARGRAGRRSGRGPAGSTAGASRNGCGRRGPARPARRRARVQKRRPARRPVWRPARCVGALWRNRRTLLTRANLLHACRAARRRVLDPDEVANERRRRPAIRKS